MEGQTAPVEEQVQAAVVEPPVAAPDAAPIPVAIVQETVAVAEAVAPVAVEAVAPVVGEEEEKKNPVPAVQPPKKQKDKKKKAKAKSPVQPSPKRKRITRRGIDSLVQGRHNSGNTTTCRLFRWARADVVNPFGDVRYSDCTMLCDAGPFRASDKAATVDWVGSANLLLISKSGKLDDTVAFSLVPSVLESQDPVDI